MPQTAEQRHEPLKEDTTLTTGEVLSMLNQMGQEVTVLNQRYLDLIEFIEKRLSFHLVAFHQEDPSICSSSRQSVDPQGDR